MIKAKVIDHNKGHRKRIIHKLKQNGYEQFADYEIVELMLFLIFKRKDTKPIAKMLLEKFKTLNEILQAADNELLQIDGVGQSTCDAFKIINMIIKATLKSKIQNKSTITCFYDVINYCKLHMKNLIHEEFRILLLNSKNEIIDDSTIQKGTIDSVEIYPRTVVKHCIDKGARALILVHNHPSGDPTPSTNDIYTTNLIIEAISIFNIVLFDHIIIGGDRYTSFRSLNLLNNN